ncbi:MAG TPA: hypothetical protein VH165_17995, partial [Kofleriaceae bacterium]|nr:hypothetical protein [Kofleriaceae bacterium]
MATATIAGLTWASDVVVLNPATISGNVAFSDTIQSYTVYAYPSTGGQPAQQSFPAPAPAMYSLTVEGGDPAVGAGKDYQLAIGTYFQGIRPSAGAYLQIFKNATVHVSSPDGNATGVDFTPTTSHVNASIEVQGGTVESYNMSAWCNTSDAQYSGQAYESIPSPYPESVTSWIVMGPCSQASASGTAYVVADDGTAIQHQLETQTVDLSLGTVDWLVDLTDTGTLAGNVSLTSTSGVGSVSVFYYGTYGTPSYGTSGAITTSSPPGSPYVATYSGTVPSGTYDVFAQICTQNGSSCADTATSQVTISHTSSPPVNFSDTLAPTQIPLAVTGFYDNTSLSYSQLELSRPDPSQEVGLSAYSSLQNGTYNFGLPTGSWNFSYLYLGITDNTDPNLAAQSSLNRYHYNDPDHPPFSVASGTPSTPPSEQVTLVKSNLYFQVGSADGGSINVSSPNVTAYKYDYNADNSLKTYFQVYATGSSTPKPIAGLTMIAEPGTYTLDARATVNGTLTPFGGTTITFGAPLQTNPTTTPEQLVLTPPGQALEVDVTYNNVSTGGITTMVQSELGPSPPEGLSVGCDDTLGGNNSGNTLCPPVYYDIKTNATWSGQTEVCIKH